MDYLPTQGGVEIFLVASCDRNSGKFRPDGPLGSYADITFNFLGTWWYYIKIMPNAERGLFKFCYT